MNRNGPRVAMLAFGTAVPPYRASQEAVGRWMAASFAEQPVLGRWLRGLYANSGIETRYACLPDFSLPPRSSRLAPGLTPHDSLTTAERMAIYQRESVKLGTTAGQQALKALSKAAQSDMAAVTETVTHLVVISCTGFFAPGLDLAIGQQLNLAPTVQRFLLGFMGCAAAFNGLRLAAQIVAGQPEARVLVVCVELCSIHIQPGTARENLISASLFADGASACLVGAVPADRGDFFEIDDFHSSVKPETTGEMVWEIGNHGFILHLSPKIPDHLAEVAPVALRSLRGNQEPPHFWAIHPGGRAIVERLADIFQLEAEDIKTSLSILRRFGNLSSATIFFVLAEMQQNLRHTTQQARVSGVAMAFGPGLVIEMAALSYVPPTPIKNDNGVVTTQGEMLQRVELT